MKEIKFSLVYRDMWQSSGKYVPTLSQLKQVAPAIIDMGCFDRVETNGGAFEQVNLLFGENPNKAVREWTAPFHAAGIQTHMLERGLNALRMNPVPACGSVCRRHGTGQSIHAPPCSGSLRKGD